MPGAVPPPASGDLIPFNNDDPEEAYMKKLIIAALLVALAALPASAKTVLDFQTTATTFTDTLVKQKNFEKLVTDIGLMTSYRAVAPSEPLKGSAIPFGFDIGVEGSQTKIDKNKDYWVDAMKPASIGGDTLSSSQYFTKVHAQIGLPVVPVEIGLVYGTSQSIDKLKFSGAEIKYAILDGTAATPALALRGSYTAISGIDILDVKTYQADISISKGILMVTPYAGIGQVWIKGKEKDTDPSIVLQDVSVSETKGFVGAKISFLPVMNLVLEGEFSTVNTYSLRLNVGF